jgi:hypothetical protein
MSKPAGQARPGFLHLLFLKILCAFFAQRDFAPQNPQGKKPGYPLQSSGFCFAKSARISASIPCAPQALRA